MHLFHSLKCVTATKALDARLQIGLHFNSNKENVSSFGVMMNDFPSDASIKSECAYPSFQDESSSPNECEYNEESFNDYFDHCTREKDYDSHTIAQYTEIKLLKLLNDINAPHDTYEIILDWAQEAHYNGYNFLPRFKKRKSAIKDFEKWQGLQHARPCQIPLTFAEDNLTIDVTA